MHLSRKEGRGVKFSFHGASFIFGGLRLNSGKENLALDLFNPEPLPNVMKQVGYEVHGGGVLRYELPDVQAILKL